MSSKVEKPIYNQLTITEIKSRTRQATEVTDIPPRKYSEWTENSRIEGFNTVYLEMDRLAEQLCKGGQRRPERGCRGGCMGGCTSGEAGKVGLWLQYRLREANHELIHMVRLEM
jgi:hypothetical protein